MRYQCTTVVNLLLFPPLPSSLTTHASIFAATGGGVFDWHRWQYQKCLLMTPNARIDSANKHLG